MSPYLPSIEAGTLHATIMHQLHVCKPALLHLNFLLSHNFMNTTSRQEGDQGRNLEREKKRKTYGNTGFEPGTCGLAAPDLNNYIGYGATTPMKYIKWIYILT